MARFKDVTLVVLIIALVSVIITAVYFVLFLRVKSEESAKNAQETTERIKAFEPTILASDQTCDFINADSEIKYFSATIYSADLGKIRQGIIDATSHYKGDIASVYPSERYDSRLKISLHEISVSLVVPINQSDAFIKMLDSLIIPPDQIIEDGVSSNDSRSLKETCQSNLGSLKNLQATERIYLAQLQKQEGTQSADELKKMVDNISRLRQNANNLISNIQQQSDNINKLQVDITIQEFAG